MAIDLAAKYAAKVRERQKLLNQAPHRQHVIVDGVAGPETRRAVIAYYMGEPVYDPEEARRLKTEAAYLSVDRIHKSATRVYKCPYCDCWSDNDIGLCEYCGAPKE